MCVSSQSCVPHSHPSSLPPSGLRTLLNEALNWDLKNQGKITGIWGGSSRTPKQGRRCRNPGSGGVGDGKEGQKQRMGHWPEQSWTALSWVSGTFPPSSCPCLPALPSSMVIGYSDWGCWLWGPPLTLFLGRIPSLPGPQWCQLCNGAGRNQQGVLQSC